MSKRKVSFSTLAVLSAFSLGAQAQIFSDDVGDATKWTIVGDGGTLANVGGGTIEDVRFGFDYGSFDLFNETVYTDVTSAAAGFITGGIGEAPNSDPTDTATTGLYFSANNSSLVDTSLFVGAFANGVSVGADTANENYVLRFDAFHSVATGLDGGGPPSATNFAYAGINTAVEGYAGPFGTPATGAGQFLAITGEQGGFDDYEVTVGGVTIEDRNEGFTGLATAYIQDRFEANGFTPGPVDDTDPENPVQSPPFPFGVNNQDDFFTSPLPTDIASFDPNVDGTFNRYWRQEFPQTTDPLHYDTAGNENANDFLNGGTPYNRWAEHEVYYVDGIWTYVIDGTPVVQVDPSEAGDGTQTADTSGTISLGFLDGFSSFNADPEGSNFVIFDNIVLEDATASEVPDMLTYLEDEGYIAALVAAGLAGDFNGNGSVEQADLDLVLTNWGGTRGFEDGVTTFSTGTVDQEELDIVLTQWGSSTAPSFEGFSVPEPATLALVGLGGLAMLRRRSA
ncbi:MAG: PEP-CTERM sorting domain-containing protein [Planctomycetota bacterium]